jgi:hypothetical protein
MGAAIADARPVCGFPVLGAVCHTTSNFKTVIGRNRSPQGTLGNPNRRSRGGVVVADQAPVSTIVLPPASPDHSLNRMPPCQNEVYLSLASGSWPPSRQDRVCGRIS